MNQKQIVVDAREFVSERRTGIGRFLEGFVYGLAEAALGIEITIASYSRDVVPAKLRRKKNIRIIKIPTNFFLSEKAMSDFTKCVPELFISPYGKLPIFGCHCNVINTVHDVLDLTHPSYKNRFKVVLDKLRLKLALRRADLTWYDSSWSMDETKKLIGFTGRNPRVRYLGIAEKFTEDRAEDEGEVLKKYDLQAGYVLAIGNGLPHKNLGVLLRISNKFSRKFVFVGVSQENQRHWRKLHSVAKAQWIPYVGEDDLPSIIRGAFCLAQPSAAEGYGYPPLEAMACGVPTVVSNIPVLIETTGGNALVADVDDPKTWIEAFEALTKKEKYLIQIERGQRWVKPFFGRKGWKKHILDIQGLITGSQP